MPYLALIEARCDTCDAKTLAYAELYVETTDEDCVPTGRLFLRTHDMKLPEGWTKKMFGPRCPKHAEDG